MEEFDIGRVNRMSPFRSKCAWNEDELYLIDMSD